jgi:hypothetical protein
MARKPPWYLKSADLCPMAIMPIDIDAPMEIESHECSNGKPGSAVEWVSISTPLRGCMGRIREFICIPISWVFLSRCVAHGMIVYDVMSLSTHLCADITCC